jgi:type IV pilus assembly protein PilO
MAKGFSDLPPLSQAIILVVIAVAGAGFVFWYYALPEVVQRDKLHTQWVRLKAENDKNEAFRQEQTEYLSRIQQLKQQLATLRSIVPDEPATDVFIKSVYDAGRSTDVFVRTFVSQPQVKKELYVEMPYRVHLDGTYYSLVSFFNRLAHEQRIVTVAGLSLGPPGGGGMGNYKVAPNETVGANCNIITYFNRPEQTPPAARAGARPVKR